MEYFAPKRALVAAREYSGSIVPIRQLLGDSNVLGTAVLGYKVVTDEGPVTLRVGDYVVRDVNGDATVYTAEGFFTLFAAVTAIKD